MDAGKITKPRRKSSVSFTPVLTLALWPSHLLTTITSEPTIEDKAQQRQTVGSSRASITNSTTLASSIASQRLTARELFYRIGDFPRLRTPAVSISTYSRSSRSIGAINAVASVPGMSYTTTTRLHREYSECGLTYVRATDTSF